MRTKGGWSVDMVSNGTWICRSQASPKIRCSVFMVRNLILKLIGRYFRKHQTFESYPKLMIVLNAKRKERAKKQQRRESSEQILEKNQTNCHTPQLYFFRSSNDVVLSGVHNDNRPCETGSPLFSSPSGDPDSCILGRRNYGCSDCSIKRQNTRYLKYRRFLTHSRQRNHLKAKM